MISNVPIGPLRSAFGLLFAIAVFVGTASARSTQEVQVVDKVEFRSLQGDKPSALAGRGYTELRWRVTNGSEEVRDVAIRVGSATGERWTNAGAATVARLEPGEVADLDLLLPVFCLTASESVSVVLDPGTSELASNFLVPVGGDDMNQRLLVGVFGDRALGAGWEEQRAAELSSQMMRGAFGMNTAPFMEPCPRWYPSAEVWMRSRAMPEARADKRRDMTFSRPSDDYSVILRPFDALPSSFAGLSSLDVVVLDGAGVDRESLAELARWVRLGGCLVVARDSSFASLGDFEDARRPERLLASFGAADVARMGLGTVVFAPGEPLSSEDQRAAVWYAIERNPSWYMPFDGETYASGPLRWHLDSVALPGVGQVSHRTLLALLLILAGVTGPINVWFVRRTGRPVAFLLTIPILALLGSLSVVAYGMSRDGLGVKDGATSYAVLDQGAHTISSVTVRGLFLGMSGGRRLQPGAGTMILPLARDPEEVWRGRFSVERDDRSGSVRYAGDYLPVRRPLEHAVYSDRSARIRLVASRENGVVRVENALGATVEALWLRDREGRVWRLEGALAEGGKADLVAADGEDEQLVEFLADLGPGPQMPGFERLAPGSYAARLDRCIAEDECGITGERSEERQALVGILEEDAL
ncbi:hypothetical protein Pla163_14750 [Planctomycetes bacterium Pla163]|uniref:Uncharacterized protein n=1 Tax=Rohdeia mirabilis TaxID=2528008 RepID=A0A518CYQ5_9BACT|nr:hypothetical protein Pla163_14750 [Planctomycetes bacterium Pla163]